MSVEGPDDRSNKATVEYWHGEPTVFATADEARAVILECDVVGRLLSLYLIPDALDPAGGAP